MNKLIDNYNDSVNALAEYFEIDNFGSYIIQECAEDYWEVEDEYINFGTNSEDLEYGSEFSEIARKEDITAVLIKDDFGGDDYWCIFYTNNEIKTEDD